MVAVEPVSSAGVQRALRAGPVIPFSQRVWRELYDCYQIGSLCGAVADLRPVHARTPLNRRPPPTNYNTARRGV